MASKRMASRMSGKRKERETRGIRLKSMQDLVLMREAGRIVGDTLVLLRRQTKPGMTTAELDAIATDYIRRRGGVPSFPLENFPHSVCVSINEELVHGIPGKRVIQPGDLVNIDVGVIYHGLHGDAGLTFSVGPVSPELQALLSVTEQALAVAIEHAQPYSYLNDLGEAVEHHVASSGFAVIEAYVGHGIGYAMHEGPNVPNYRPDAHKPGVQLRPGMVLAIEPMVTAGGIATHVLPDEWTVVTDDNSLSAQFEHTVAITADGPVILTRPTDPDEMWAEAPSTRSWRGERGLGNLSLQEARHAS